MSRQKNGRVIWRICSQPLSIRTGGFARSMLRAGFGLWMAMGSPLNAADAPGWDGHTFGTFWENDATARSDRHYTQGAGIWYISPDYTRPAWVHRLSEWLPAAGVNKQAHKVRLAMTQEIYTPEDLRDAHVVENDRPYAGWLYANVTLERRGPGWFARPGLDRWGLDVGVVGPHSLAEETQKAWHGVDPKGWDNELEFEPGLVLRYDRYSLFRFGSSSGWVAEVIPSFGGAAGNVDINAHLATSLRLGYNIRDDFAIPAPPLRFGVFVFGDAEGRYVAHNVFLDGNLWRASHRIDKEPWVAEFAVGITFLLKRVEITFRQTLRTREFEGQRTNDSFGAALLNFRF